MVGVGSEVDERPIVIWNRIQTDGDFGSPGDLSPIGDGGFSPGILSDCDLCAGRVGRHELLLGVQARSRNAFCADPCRKRRVEAK